MSTADAGGRRAPPGLPRALPLGGAAARPLLRARRALRLAGVASSRADDLHRRARADAARTRDRRTRASRRGEACRTAASHRSSPMPSPRSGGSGSSTASWAAAKLILVLAMTATIFPAYGLARMVVPKWYALGAAGAAVAVPALAYAPILVEEPLAYPVATLALWLIARALERPTLGSRRSRVRGLGRRGTDADAARRPVRGARARAALARVGVGGRQTLALLVETLGLGRRRDPARRSRVGASRR